MQQDALYTARLLTRTPGYPTNWTADTVQILGLADPDHVLQEQKIRALDTMSHREIQAALDLPQSNVSLNVSRDNRTLRFPPLTNGTAAYLANGNGQYVDDFNASGTEWDLYWVGNSPPATTARHVYTDTDETVLFDEMAGNRTNYTLMVAENPNVSTSELANDDELRTFVDNGGVYWQDQTGTVIDTFGISRGTAAGDGDGTVDTARPAVHYRLDAKDAVTIRDVSYYGTNADTQFVNRSSGSGCWVCRWEYGNGTVYYLSNSTVTQDTVSDHNLTTDAVYDANALTGLDLFLGRPLADAEDVAVARRSVVVNGTNVYERGTLTVVLWR